MQDVQLSHSPLVFLLLNPHCQCLSPSSICFQGNITVPWFLRYMGLTQANSIGLPLSSNKPMYPSQGRGRTHNYENDTMVLVFLSRKWHFLVSAVTTEGIFSVNSASLLRFLFINSKFLLYFWLFSENFYSLKGLETDYWDLFYWSECSAEGFLID